MEHRILGEEIRDLRFYLTRAIFELFSSPEESPIEFGPAGGWVAALPEGYTDDGCGYEDVQVRIWQGLEAVHVRDPDMIVSAGDYLSKWYDPRDLEMPYPFVVTYNGNDEQYGYSDYELWAIDAAHDLRSWAACRTDFSTIKVTARHHSGIVNTRNIYEYYAIGEDVYFIALEQTYKSRGLSQNASVDYIDTLQAVIEDLKEVGETDLEPYQTRLNTLLSMAGREGE